MKISFNLRLSYTECMDCVDKIQELGGDGNATVGGSWFTGTKKQIDNLLIYMGEKNYDMGSLAINEDPREATQTRIDMLKEDDIIE